MSFDGLTEDGLDVPTGNEWLTFIRDSIDERLPGEESFPYTENDVLGALTNEMAFRLAQLSEILQTIDDTKSIQTAYGTHLEDAAGLIGVEKQEGRPSLISDQLFEGEFQATVPSNTVIQGGGDKGNLRWETLGELELGIVIVPDQDLSNKPYDPGIRGSSPSPWAGNQPLPDKQYTLEVSAPASSSPVSVPYNPNGSGKHSELVKAWRTNLQNSSIAGMLDVSIRDIGQDNDVNALVIRSAKGFDIDANVLEDEVNVIKGAGYVSAEALEVGANVADNGDVPYTADSEAIGRIIGQVEGVDSTRNVVDATIGSPPDDDSDLRLGHTRRLQRNATGSANAIRAKLEGLDFIEAATVPENDNPDTTLSLTSNLDLPPNSVAVIVWPDVFSSDEEDAIVKTVYRNLSHGMGAVEDTNVPSSRRFTKTVETKGQNTKDITFYTAAEKQIDVETRVVIAGTYDQSDIRPQIQSTLENYIAQLSVSDDVRRLEMFRLIAEIPGVQTAEKLDLQKETNGFVSSDISIDFVEIASPDSITVDFG